MKCPVTGSLCKKPREYSVNVVMANEDGPIAEGPVTNQGVDVTICGDCRANCSFDKVMDFFSFLTVQDKFRSMGQPIPNIASSYLKFEKKEDLQ
jgi:hypothetical protein